MIPIILYYLYIYAYIFIYYVEFIYKFFLFSVLHLFIRKLLLNIPTKY